MPRRRKENKPKQKTVAVVKTEDKPLTEEEKAEQFRKTQLAKYKAWQKKRRQEGEVPAIATALDTAKEDKGSGLIIDHLNKIRARGFTRKTIDDAYAGFLRDSPSAPAFASSLRQAKKIPEPNIKMKGFPAPKDVIKTRHRQKMTAATKSRRKNAVIRRASVIGDYVGIKIIARVTSGEIESTCKLVQADPRLWRIETVRIDIEFLLERKDVVDTLSQIQWLEDQLDQLENSSTNLQQLMAEIGDHKEAYPLPETEELVEEAVEELGLMRGAVQEMTMARGVQMGPALTFRDSDAAHFWVDGVANSFVANGQVFMGQVKKMVVDGKLLPPVLHSAADAITREVARQVDSGTDVGNADGNIQCEEFREWVAGSTLKKKLKSVNAQLLPVHSALVDLYASTGSERWKKRDGWLISDDVTPWYGIHLRTSATTSAAAGVIASWASACADGAVVSSTHAIVLKVNALAAAAAAMAAMVVKHMAGRRGNEWVASFLTPRSAEQSIAEQQQQSMAGIPLSVIKERETAAEAEQQQQQQQQSMAGIPLSVIKEREAAAKEGKGGRAIVGKEAGEQEAGEQEAPVMSEGVTQANEDEAVQHIDAVEGGAEGIADDASPLPPMPAAATTAAAAAVAALPPASVLLAPRKSISTAVDSTSSWFQHSSMHGTTAAMATNAAAAIAAEEAAHQGSPGLLRGHCSVRLDRLELAHNQLTGELPSTLGDLGGVRVIDLHGNLIGGYLPPSIGKLKMLEQLLLSHNKIRSSIPKEMGECEKLKIFRATDNQLRGSLPVTLSWCANLQELNLNNNQLHGEIPSIIGEKCMLLTQLLLSKNNLEGNIPDSIFGLKRLKKLNLSHNSLTGCIPKKLGDCESLQWLDLQFNELSRHIPDDVADLKHLQGLWLSHNKLRGNLPPLDYIENLMWCDLSSNFLTGRIPDEIGDCVKLKTLNLCSNSLKGEIPDTLCTCTKLTSLQLSSNKLSGRIPEEILGLPLLRIFELRNNKLSGPLTLDLAQMPNLRTLDLGFNQFVGSVPNAFALRRSEGQGPIERVDFRNNKALSGVDFMVMFRTAALDDRRNTGKEGRLDYEGCHRLLTKLKLPVPMEDMTLLCAPIDGAGLGSLNYVQLQELIAEIKAFGE
jgi:Leucine-rich repeat (LRR) protein